MKNVVLKRKNSLLKGVVMGFAMLAALLLLTNCGSSKSAGSTPGNVAVQAPEYELSNDYALLHFFRPNAMVGIAVSYGLFMDGEDLFLVKNNSKKTIKVTSAGQKLLTARTETRTELPINIQMGREYYIRCGLKMGAFVGRPTLQVVDNKKGKEQFDKIRLR
jgi:hypothetical protein